VDRDIRIICKVRPGEGYSCEVAEHPIDFLDRVRFTGKGGANHAADRIDQLASFFMLQDTVPDLTG